MNHTEIHQFRDIAEPLERLRQTSDTLNELQARIAEISEIRREAIEELRAKGLTLAQIAKHVGISVARLSQLAAPKRRPERALLGAQSKLFVGVPVEQAPYPEGPQRPVVHKDDAEFLRQLEALGKQYDFSVECEYVGPGEFVDLNRDGVVVTCGPRQSPWLEQILASDVEYGFEKDSQGWYLLDKQTGEQHRSPGDRGEHGDYGYLGSLPRPDGQGAWMFIAGIHAPGSRGGALYLQQHIEELYQETRGHFWSCLVRCSYDPTTREVTSAELLAPVRRRGRIRPRK